jgi:hypothetical protein
MIGLACFTHSFTHISIARNLGRVDDVANQVKTPKNLKSKNTKNPKI